jgi:hypothetical protein
MKAGALIRRFEEQIHESSREESGQSGVFR